MSALKQNTKRIASSAKGWSKPISDNRRKREARAALRAEIPSIVTPISLDEAAPLSADVLPLFDSTDLLLRRATEELRRVQNDMLMDEQRRQEHLHKLLSDIYTLSMDGKRNQDRHRQRLERTKVAVRADTPFHKQTVRALLAEAGIKVKKSTEHEWTRVVTALEHDEVAETETAVAQWLTEEAVVNGVSCRGFHRAEVTLRGSKTFKDAQRQRHQERDAEERATFTEAVTSCSPFGNIEPSDGETCPTGLWLSLNRNGEVLRLISVSEMELRALVLKHAREQ
uniref:Uncharacterized protein n=1 Tax=Bosea sp. NBC_00436 TaxID=2969620 RepID=A0A9E8CP63_9HYPH